MQFENDTWNQHFISQAEQRSNAIPGTNQIYEFKVQVKDPADLGTPRRVSIRRNLSFDDLFTFERDKTGPLRKNLEDVFGRYESRLGAHTSEVLEAVEAQRSPSGRAVHGLFVSKFLNLLRNPYCVRKALNTIGLAANYKPADPNLELMYERVKAANLERRQPVCDAFGLLDTEYDRWLRCLFMMLVELPQAGSSLLEQTVAATLSRSHTILRVHTFDDDDSHVCLLSDRGFLEPRREEGVSVLQFNLSSRAFATFSIYEEKTFEHEMRNSGGLSDIEWELACRHGLVKPGVRVTHNPNDTQALTAYNQLAVYQCAERVFAAHPRPVL